MCHAVSCGATFGKPPSEAVCEVFVLFFTKGTNLCSNLNSNISVLRKTDKTCFWRTNLHYIFNLSLSWFKLIDWCGIISEDDLDEYVFTSSCRSKNMKSWRSSNSIFFLYSFVWFGSDAHLCWGWQDLFSLPPLEMVVDIMQPDLVLHLIGISRTQIRIVRRRSLLLLQVTSFNLYTDLFPHLSLYPSFWVPTLMSEHAP